ncbi:MAG TPA: sulfotransferase domain-containing protein [Gemmatimonadaceae bacterium]|nr:sulfotransferase domain-containing protein [Gemmatimonadaceae bacterium]
MTRLTVAELSRRFSARLYVDLGGADATTLIAGMGRSGTTWVAAVVNHDFSHRIVFEPFRPHVVRAAEAFGPFPYVRPADRDGTRVAAAEAILSGRTPRGTVDRGHRGRVFRRRIVKEVRCNLMLGWLQAIRPRMPIVLVMRNPFAVAASWVRLGWGRVPGEARSEVDVILAQDELLEDFPVVSQAASAVDPGDPFERSMFQWAVAHLVPLRQLDMRAAHLLHYEDLILRPDETVDMLAAYLDRSIAGPGRDRALAANTDTDFLGRGSDADRRALLGEFREVLSQRQLARGREILAALGVIDLYDADGLPSAGQRTQTRQVPVDRGSSRGAP